MPAVPAEPCAFSERGVFRCPPVPRGEPDEIISRAGAASQRGVITLIAVCPIGLTGPSVSQVIGVVGSRGATGAPPNSGSAEAALFPVNATARAGLAAILCNYRKGG